MKLLKNTIIFATATCAMLGAASVAAVTSALAAGLSTAPKNAKPENKTTYHSEDNSHA